jgi:hypothetical protein
VLISESVSVPSDGTEMCYPGVDPYSGSLAKINRTTIEKSSIEFHV